MPQPHEMPVELRGFTPAEATLLSPMILHQGDYWRPHPQGCRFSGGGSWLSWKPRSVQAQLVDVEDDHVRGRLQQAYRWLVAENQYYCKAIVEHEQALEKGQLQVSRWKLAARGIEAVLFPDLYCHEEWLDSLVSEDGKHRSAKRSFEIKMRCAILDYGACFSLVQLQHDRWLLTKLLGRGHAVPALALKWAAADVPYCPTYFLEFKYALADMHRHKGPAQLFLTIAPGIFATAWPEMVASSRPAEARLSSGVEAIHLHHMLVQVFERYILGTKAKGHDVFVLRGCKVQGYAWRLEYQSGSRRADYHGTGVPHLHAVLWATDLQKCPLGGWLSADLGTTPLHIQATMRQQRSHQASPGGTQQGWQWETGAGWQLHLQQGAVAKEMGIRTHCVPLAIAHVGHQDWQVLPQSTQNMAAHGLHCQGGRRRWGGLGPACNFCLCGGATSPTAHQAELCANGAGVLHKSLVRVPSDTKRVVLNLPGEHEELPPLKHYLARPAAEEGLTYLEWLRLYRADLPAPVHYRRARDVALQVHYGDRLKDAFLGQWLVANVPHRAGADLVDDAVVASVPERLRYFAMCMHLQPKLWGEDFAALAWEPLPPTLKENLLHLYQAWKATVRLAWQGKWPRAGQAPAMTPELPLSASQAAVFDAVTGIIEDDCAEKRGFLVSAKQAPARPTWCTPCCRKPCGRNGVLVVTPTARLADVYRQH